MDALAISVCQSPAELTELVDGAFRRLLATPICARIYSSESVRASPADSHRPPGRENTSSAPTGAAEEGARTYRERPAKVAMIVYKSQLSFGHIARKISYHL